MITSLHHYALAVPELAVADTFLQGFGLHTAAEAGALVARCPGRDQEQVRMLEGPVKKLHHVAFTVRSLDEVRARLDRAGVPIIDPPDGGTDVGLWVRDPDGTPVQLIDTPPTPARSVPEVHANVGATYTRFDTAGWLDTQDVMPRRLGHTLLFTGQPERQVAFYTETLDLAVTDRIADKVAFLNAGPGDHHVFGFITSTHAGFHHASYEVPSIDAIGLGAVRMRDAGYERGWGLGRHAVGSNFFHYTADPWGSWIEWFSDLDQIRECWTPKTWDVPPHLWGPPPPPEFLDNREPRP